MIQVFDDVDKLLISLADFIVERAGKTIESAGRFSFVLSGGSSPKQLYELLSSPGYKAKIEWDKVYFFFGDERYVPLTSSQSNFLMARQTLFDPLAISEDHIFAVNTALSPAEAAHAYQKVIEVYFGNKPLSFDLILLGLGDNAHTASLFPNSPILNEERAIIKEVFVDEVNMYRITFTAPLINLARGIVFLVYGLSKAEAVKHVLRGEKNKDRYPAQLIAPEKDEARWFLDRESARGIEPS